MRIFSYFLVLVISCGVKKSPEVNQSLKVVNDLVGKWSKQASCDRSIKCYDCPEVFFKADGYVIYRGNPTYVAKWELVKERLKIINIFGDSLIEEGEYSTSFKERGSEVELINRKNGDCHLLYKKVE